MFFVDCCIDEINDMLFAAYVHGGDGGGPYGSNPKLMQDSIEAFLNKTYLNKEYMYAEINRIIDRNKYLRVPQIIKKVPSNSQTYGWE